MNQFKFKLGSLVKDMLSGFTGIIVARADYMTGCCRYGIASQKLDEKTGKPMEWVWFDENVLELVKENGLVLASMTKEDKPGGPRSGDQDAPSR